MNEAHAVLIAEIGAGHILQGGVMDRFDEEARSMVRKFCNINDTEMSIADIGWLNTNIAAWGRKLVQEEQVGALKPAPKTKEGAKS